MCWNLWVDDDSMRDLHHSVKEELMTCNEQGDCVRGTVWEVLGMAVMLQVEQPCMMTNGAVYQPEQKDVSNTLGEGLLLADITCSDLGSQSN